MTERKLTAALAKIDRWKAGKSRGKPMSGLSIPANYYFAAKSRSRPSTGRRKAQPRAAAR